MKSLMAASVLAFSAALVSTPTLAFDHGKDKVVKVLKKEVKHHVKPKKEIKKKKVVKLPPKKTGHSVPEMDAAGMALGLGLIGGVAALMRERRKSRTA